jgi:glycosyltransferase involved in cell wall biosynthesis
MIRIVYGYLVKHGGVGRYISEVVSRSSRQSEIEIVTLEQELTLPEKAKVIRVDCKRDKQFLSVSENLDFSDKVNELATNGGLTHSHGVYRIRPDIYTAHICLKTYFDRVKSVGGQEEIPDDAEKIVSLEMNILANSKKVTAVSGKVADELCSNYGLDRRDIVLVKGASRFKPFSFQPNVLRADSSLTLGFIGGNLKAKGADLIVRAANRLKGAGKKVKVIGAGTNQGINEHFKKKAKFNFELIGKVELGSDFYRDLDIFICSSTYEAYSLSTLEAMALGIPVISSNSNGVFYDNPDATLARVEDITDDEELAEVVMRTHEDYEFRKRIVSAGRKVSLQTSWEEIAKAYDLLYHSF